MDGAPEDHVGSAESAEPAAPVPSPEPTPPNPRQVRARRRRHRRQLGTLIFVVVAAAILAAAYFAVAGGDDSSDDASRAARSGSTTSTTTPFIGIYPSRAGINVRQGPGTNFPTVGVVERGRDVAAACVAEGEQVDAPTGPSSQWLKVAGPWASGYVSAGYVDTGDDLTAKKIPACPPS